MPQNWEQELLLASQRRDAQDEARFLELVSQARDRVSLEIARVLMKTFSANEDFGTQERVCSVLSSGASEVQTRAILEELPRLMQEAPEWAEVLVGDELNERLDIVNKLLPAMPQDVKVAVRQLINDPDFADMYENASKIRF